ncbi:MAG TPA: hypothetical protein VGM53_07055 [Streptosporangiaceae bacterium]
MSESKTSRNTAAPADVQLTSDQRAGSSSPSDSATSSSTVPPASN